MGLALSILSAMAESGDWESLWPAFQKAIIGLGSAAILALKGQAIAVGLTDLADRIGSSVASLGGDIDVSGNVQDESRTLFGDTSLPTVSLPYVEPGYTLNDTQEMFKRVEFPGWFNEFAKRKKPKIVKPAFNPDAEPAKPVGGDTAKSTVKLPRVGRSTGKKEIQWHHDFKVPPSLEKWAIEATVAVSAMKRMAGLLPSNAGARILRYVSSFERILLDVTRAKSIGDVVVAGEHARAVLNAFRSDWPVLSGENWHIVDGGKAYAVSAKHFVEVAGKFLADFVAMGIKK